MEALPSVRRGDVISRLDRLLQRGQVASTSGPGSFLPCEERRCWLRPPTADYVRFERLGGCRRSAGLGRPRSTSASRKTCSAHTLATLAHAAS